MRTATVLHRANRTSESSRNLSRDCFNAVLFVRNDPIGSNNMILSLTASYFSASGVIFVRSDKGFYPKVIIYCDACLRVRFVARQ